MEENHDANCAIYNQYQPHKEPRSVARVLAIYRPANKKKWELRPSTAHQLNHLDMLDVEFPFSKIKHYPKLVNTASNTTVANF